jgi:hypothetical protein
MFAPSLHDNQVLGYLSSLPIPTLALPMAAEAEIMSCQARLIAKQKKCRSNLSTTHAWRSVETLMWTNQTS